MTLLLIRVLVAPALVAAGSLAQRRWGLTVGGRLVGLPLTAMPLLALMTWTNGDHFAAKAATAILAGGIGASIWCLVYALAARRSRPIGALAAATLAFGAVAFGLDHVDCGLLTAAAACAACLLAALFVWPPARGEDRPLEHSRRELPVRMAVAAVFTFALSSAAGSLGARSAGLVGSLPVLTIVLAVAAHRQGGPEAANRFLRGVLAGSWSLVASITVLAFILPTAGAPIAFSVAVVTALAAQLIADGCQRNKRRTRLRTVDRAAPAVSRASMAAS